VNKNGEQEKGGLELKTDGDGKTGIDGIRYGKLRVQVIAKDTRPLARILRSLSRRRNSSSS